MSKHRGCSWFSGVILALMLVSGPVLAQDPSPTFTKVFAPDEIGQDSVSMLIFTIDHTGRPDAVSEMAFTDTLPTGMELAAPAFVSNTCFGTVTALNGGDTITLTGGRVGAGLSCEIIVNVTANTDGCGESECTNTTGDLTSDAGNSGTATASLRVTTDRPGFSKSFAPSTIEFHARSTLTFTLDNSMNDAFALSALFTDNLPPSMVVATPSNASSDCTFFSAPVITAVPGTNLIGFSGGGVDAGDFCTVTVDVIGAAIGSLGNVSGELNTGFSPQLSSGRSAAVLEVTGVTTLLELGKEFVDDPVAPGGTTTLEFTVTNKSRDDLATGISFSDDLGFALVGLAPSGPLPADPCGAGSSLSFTPGVSPSAILSLTGGSLPPGGRCTFGISLAVPGDSVPGTYPNTAGPVTGDVGGSPETGNVAGDLLFVVSFPILTKEFTDDPVGAGSTVTLEFTITNPEATSTMSAITFEDIFDTILPTSPSGAPAPGFCGPGSTATFTPLIIPPSPSSAIPATLTVTGASLAAAGNPGDSCTFSITLDVIPGASFGAYPNLTGTITAELDDFMETPTVVGPPASDDLAVVGAPRLRKNFTDDPVPPGGTVTLDFTLEYSGLATDDATDVAFSDDLTKLVPAIPGLTAASVNPGSDCTGMVDISTTPTLIVYSGGTMIPGETCTISLTLSVPVGADPGFHANNTSEVTASIGGIAVTGNGAADDLLVTGLLFSKEFSNDPVIAGATDVSLVFTLDNMSGTGPVTDISFTDDLDDALTGMQATAETTNTCGGMAGGFPTSFFVFAGGSVAAGASCSIALTLSVPASTVDGTYTNRTSALGTSLGILPAAVDKLVVDSSLLTITKEFTDDPVIAGEPVTLKFIISNPGDTGIATGIAFSDDLEATLTGLEATGATLNECGGMASFPTSLFEYAGGTLGPGSSCTIILTLDVPPAPLAGNIFPNTTSEVTGVISDLGVTGAPASDDLLVKLINFSKVFDGPATAPGTAILSFTIENLDSLNAVSGLAFSDDLDAVLPGLVASSLPATPCGAGSSITGTSFLTLVGGNLAAQGSPGDSCTFDVTVTFAAASEGTHVNKTSNLFSLGLTVAAPATAILVIVPAPAFAKNFAPDAIISGTTSTLTFSIDNSSSIVDATDLDFTDNMPTAITVASPANASNTCGGTLTAAPGTSVVSLNGGTATGGAGCAISVDVTSTSNGAHVNTSGDLTSSLGNSGAANDGLNVVGGNVLSISKMFLTAPTLPGGNIEVEYTITNASLFFIANDIEFTDDFDAAIPGMVAVGLPTADICGTGSSLTGTSLLALSGGSLAAETSCTFLVTLKVPADAMAGIFTSTSSSVTATFGGVAMAAVVVSGPPAAANLQIAFLDFEKEFDGQTMAGGSVGLSFTITNPDPSNSATNISFTDDLDATLAGLVAVGLPLNDVCGAGSQLSGTSLITLTGGSLGPGENCSFSVSLDIPDMLPGGTGIFVNVTSAISADVGGSPVTGDPADAATALLIVILEAVPIPLLSPWVTILLVFLFALLASFGLQRRTDKP